MTLAPVSEPNLQAIVGADDLDRTFRSLTGSRSRLHGFTNTDELNQYCALAQMNYTQLTPNLHPKVPENTQFIPMTRIQQA